MVRELPYDESSLPTNSTSHELPPLAPVQPGLLNSRHHCGNSRLPVGVQGLVLTAQGQGQLTHPQGRPMSDLGGWQWWVHMRWGLSGKLAIYLQNSTDMMKV